jgi:signal transduction histidine kinase
VINLKTAKAPKIFARVGNPTQGQRVQSSGEEGAIWLELAAITLAMAIGFSSRVGSGTLENKPVVRSPQLMGGEPMLLYEMLIAIGIAVVLVVAAIDRLAARVTMGPEKMALLRLARAAAAQRRLVASAAQQEREARAAAAAQQERLARAAAAQRRLVAYWTHALAAPLPARLATLITQLEPQDVSA